jgi:hypothetical protein
MKNLLFGMLLLLSLIPVTIENSAFSQQNNTGLDFDEPVSEVAVALADYHLRLAQLELSRNNQSGAEYHFELAGLSQNDLSDFVDRVLNAQEKEEIQNNGPENCVINPATNVEVDVLCMR